MPTLAEVQKVLDVQFPLPAPYKWKLENYCADYDFGIGDKGSGVKVGVTRPRKIIGNMAFFKAGTLVILVPTHGKVNDFQLAAQKIYTHNSMKDRGILPRT